MCLAYASHSALLRVTGFQGNQIWLCPEFAEGLWECLWLKPGTSREWPVPGGSRHLDKYLSQLAATLCIFFLFFSANMYANGHAWPLYLIFIIHKLLKGIYTPLSIALLQIRKKCGFTGPQKKHKCQGPFQGQKQDLVLCSHGYTYLHIL